MYSHCVNGGWILGNTIDGTQAEYVRIPFADTSLYHVPAGADEEALVMLSDILPTGFECGVLNGKVQPGSTIAIVGAGPIGLAALLTSQFYSPAEIIMIDLDDNRLAMSSRFGATTPINNKDGKAIEKIMRRASVSRGGKAPRGFLSVGFSTCSTKKLHVQPLREHGWYVREHDDLRVSALLSLHLPNDGVNPMPPSINDAALDFFDALKALASARLKTPNFAVKVDVTFAAPPGAYPELAADLTEISNTVKAAMDEAAATVFPPGGLA
jgi:hypothetical protein